MTTPRRLAVLFTPSPLQPSWRAALAARAAELGWITIDPDAPTGDADAPADRDALILTEEIGVGGAWGATEWVILADRSDAAKPPATDHEPPALEVVPTTATRFAAAAALASQGWPVLQQRSDILSLPGLGEVRRPRSDARASGSAGQRPLALYDTLPVPVGASAEWHPDLFTYPLKGEMTGGSPGIDLTGRVRPLVLGPYITLPPGLWRAELRLSIDPERGQAPLRFEWGSGHAFVAAIAEVTAPGIYEIALDRRWLECEPADAHIWNYLPVFQGRIEMLGCRVTRMPDDTPETSGR